MNELSNHNFTNQEIVNLIGIQSTNVNALIGRVGELTNEVGNLSKEMVSMRRDFKEELMDVKNDIRDIKNNTEVTTQQKKTIKRAVSKQVYLVLGLPSRRDDWNKNDIDTAQKYLSLFYQRCYSETARLGHLGSPYETTISQNFTQAIKDIEAWSPLNGIEALKREADENRIARAAIKARDVMKTQGYK